MAAKPENTFISSVHRHLPPVGDLHREKMNNPYRSGTADWWYSGLRADLWVEYKFLPKIPVRAAILPDLSELQKLWLRGRYNEGRNVAVIVGCPQGGVIFQDMSWESPMSPEKFQQLLISRQALARWLVFQTTED